MPGLKQAMSTGVLLAVCLQASLCLTGCQSTARQAAGPAPEALDVEQLAQDHFGNDWAWYAANVPAIDTPNQAINDVYFYRWHMFKSHFRHLHNGTYLITEFAPPVSWQGPFAGISAAAGHHINEARWIKDPRVLQDNTRFWLDGMGNPIQYSSWLSDAAFQAAKVNGDRAWIESLLPVMVGDYERWEAHRYDTERAIYWQKPVEDATEFTTSGYMVGNGWEGDVYRPTINAYMYGNAKAIEQVATWVGEHEVATTHANKAEHLKQAVQGQLWNDQHHHFMDRLTDRYPELAFQCISGPELNGYVPWVFNLPDDTPGFAKAWEKVLDPDGFKGAHGLRTITPDSPYYMVETRTPGQTPGECEWNGPSWPYQTSQVLVAMANVLNDYDQDVLTQADYFDALLAYTHEQFKDGKPYISENLNPDTGAWIADFENRSEHYNHSTYGDLVLGGLLGIRPQLDDTLVLNPLVPSDWPYFAVENLTYHGHDVSVVYDRDGSHYGLGVHGLNVSVNGRWVVTNQPLGKLVVDVPAAKPIQPSGSFVNVAFNDMGKAEPGLVRIDASHAGDGNDPMQAIDGRAWDFDMPVNRWTSQGSTRESDWLQLDCPESHRVSSMRVFLYANQAEAIASPKTVVAQAKVDGAWQTLATLSGPVAGTWQTLAFEPVEAGAFRLVLTHQPGKASAVSEWQVIQADAEKP